MPDLLDLLKQYPVTDERECAIKCRMINFIQSFSNCFDRACEHGHITASAWLEDCTGQKALLLHHAKLNLWIQPGGHCDGQTDVLSVAIKEAKEESGINHIEPVTPDIFDIDIHLIPANGKDPAHYHYDVRFLLRITDHQIPRLNHESTGLCWVTKDPSSLPTQELSVVRMFQKWCATL